MTKDPIIIGDVEKFSIVDFPNHIAAVVFMQGCPWRCPFCYNLSLQNIGGTPESGWTFEKLMSFLEKRRNVLDGVVFSGGEPLVQENLPEVMDAVRELGYKIGLHTGGYRPEMLDKIIRKVDWVGLDVKAPLQAERYRQATGGYGLVEKILDSLRILVKSGIPFECRTTCDPRILNIADLYQIAESLKSVGVQEYYLQKYRPIPSDTATTEEMCAVLVDNAELNQFMKNSFAVFDVRK